MKIVLMIICQNWDEAAGRDMVVFIVEAAICDEWSSLYITSQEISVIVLTELLNYISTIDKVVIFNILIAK